jgi:Flp pilus assembly protein TadD
MAFLAKDNLDNAAADFSEAARLNPGDAESRLWLAWVFLRTGEWDRAIEGFTECVRLSPRFAAAFKGRGQAHYHKNNLGRALADLDEALRLEPNDAEAYVCRVYALAVKEEYGRAVRDCEAALGLDPKNAVAHNNLAWLLATCPKDEVRDGARAVEEARVACELTGWKESYALGTLAAAYAEAGDFAEAVRLHKEALGMPDYARQFGDKVYQRLKLYEEGKPYREKWAPPVLLSSR